MSVGELKELLSNINDDANVFVFKMDDTGNEVFYDLDKQYVSVENKKVNKVESVSFECLDQSKMSSEYTDIEDAFLDSDLFEN